MNLKLLSITVLLVAIVGVACVTAQDSPKIVPVSIAADSQNGGYAASNAMDGDPNTMWHTQFSGISPAHPHELTIDLGQPYPISGFTYIARTDDGNGTIGQYELYVSESKTDMGTPVATGEFTKPVGTKQVELLLPATGRYVRLRALTEVNGTAWTSVAELTLHSPGVRFVASGAVNPALLLPIEGPLSDIETEFVTLLQDIKKQATFARFAEETYREESLILESDRDPVDIVLRRTKALLVDIQSMPSAPTLTTQTVKLTSLSALAETVDPLDMEARLDLFREICSVRREIAFSNPLINFDEIVFIKRHRALYNHMCDQYYGMAATPGGGVYVLENAFSDSPSVRDILADAVVENGRLEGQKLSGGPTTPPALRFDGSGNIHGPDSEGGTFLSPDLSYDGEQLLFAYVENTGDPTHHHHVDPSRGHWTESRCYHIFKVNVDGTGLEQLTDGTFNDFDPCFLPNGRIAFITERRGGYLRCGRVCPNYTLYDMEADGSDIACLSPHETNEWQPSVTNEGQIVWTRWDYVDRHGCTAHMPWLTTLDGRDPRPVHGNYAPRPIRPDMELDCRAIPGSTKMVATAAPHHGQSYGSLILIDPSVPDDDGMGPVKRITPEIGFPESQGGPQVYGTPWALNEDYYLCVYDASMRVGGGRQGNGFVRGDYGIYLVDAFGNRELLYRDPEIASLSPLPLQAREMPVAQPTFVERGPITDASVRHLLTEPLQEPEGVVAVMNVYDSLKPYPEGTVIKALRVYQVFPMSVPSGGLRPHETGLRVASAGDSVVPTRFVLGTVPVEEDGSAHFTVPAHKEIFFQCIDQDGLAIQSMRSATHVQNGDRLVCTGCHAQSYKATPTYATQPIALTREPSRLVPDVSGSNPFSYPLLVQPVLDAHCVTCHEEEEDAMSLAAEPIVNHWYTSYNNLVHDYAFTNYGDSYRTTPGQFGARASKLYEILQKGHYDVELSDEESHRINLWLDSTSMFYGVYEREGGLAQLRGELAFPTLE
jgi:hypothetical protein